ncbi:uncharacterized protein LOC144591757, partial [Rhinoraja longicauda]
MAHSSTSLECPLQNRIISQAWTLLCLHDVRYLSAITTTSPTSQNNPSHLDRTLPKPAQRFTGRRSREGAGDVRGEEWPSRRVNWVHACSAFRVDGGAPRDTKMVKDREVCSQELHQHIKLTGRPDLDFENANGGGRGGVSPRAPPPVSPTRRRSAAPWIQGGRGEGPRCPGGRGQPLPIELQSLRTPDDIMAESGDCGGDSVTSTSTKQKGGKLTQAGKFLKRIWPRTSSKKDGQNTGITTEKQSRMESRTSMECEPAEEEREQCQPRGRGIGDMVHSPGTDPSGEIHHDREISSKESSSLIQGA